jgi:NAD(P)-dependent dehydrogenase (short-subunit alcohol dehydrogenase family)
VNISEFSLDGKVAIITGGRRGLAKAIALAFAKAGADIAVCDLVVEGGELEAVAEEIEGLGRRSLAVQTDITQKSDVDILVQKVMNEFGHIDILVNSAAVVVRLPLLELSEDDWDKTMNTDLKGYFLCSQSVGREMVNSKKGSIINISSCMGIRVGGKKNRGTYAIAKAGVIMLTKVLALELATYNIRVNAIAPYLIKTEFSQPLWSDPKVLKQMLAEVPIGHLAEPSDVASVALFLASGASSYITGHALAVDGGWLI